MNLRGELSAETRAEASAIDARLRQTSVADLLRKIEALEARLESTPGSDPAEEQKRSKRSADAANAAHFTMGEAKQTPASGASRRRRHTPDVKEL